MNIRKILLLVLAICVCITGCSYRKGTSGPEGLDRPDTGTQEQPSMAPAAGPTAEPSPEPTEEPTAEPVQEYEEYTGQIPHIFIHCLIAYPEYKRSDGLMVYDNECINVTEFKRLLEELYRNGYSLINIHDAYYLDEQGNYHVSESVRVPAGRKPLIFSADDVVYDVKKRGNGMVDFLTLDEDNNIMSGTFQKDGTARYSDDNEFIPILERFIEGHPDFSSDGARMTLCMTGFTGVFGYRTDRHYKGDRDGEIKKARAVADRLKELGYNFASHTYGHYDMTKLSIDRLEQELASFQDEVVPVIGPVDILVYPYGKLIMPDDGRYNSMMNYGFRVFCSVSHFFYLRDYEDGKSIYMTRVAIDGYSLRNYKTVLAPLLDTDKVIDKENR